MPPPPCELLLTVMASMAAGLHLKLATNLQSVESLSGTQPALLVALQLVVFGFSRPLPSTVIPAPSYAPINVGSCSSSARLPLVAWNTYLDGNRAERLAEPTRAGGAARAVVAGLRRAAGQLDAPQDAPGA